MMIQQILPPQKLLLLHIYTTSGKFFSGICRSFQDIPAREFGAKNTGEDFLSGMLYLIMPENRLSTLRRRC